MLGDFNARVGSRAVDDDEWWYKRGPHGYGELNDLAEICCLFSPQMKQLCVTHGFKRGDLQADMAAPPSHASGTV